MGRNKTHLAQGQGRLELAVWIRYGSLNRGLPNELACLRPSASLKVSWLALVSALLLPHGHEADICRALASGMIGTTHLSK